MKLTRLHILPLLIVGWIGCSTSKNPANTSAPQFFEYEIKTKSWEENRSYKIRMVIWSEITCQTSRLVVVGFGNPETKQVTCLEFYKREPNIMHEAVSKLGLIGRDNRYEPITVFHPVVNADKAIFEIARETPITLEPRKRWMYSLQYCNGRIIPDLSELIFDLPPSK